MNLFRIFYLSTSFVLITLVGCESTQRASKSASVPPPAPAESQSTDLSTTTSDTAQPPADSGLIIPLDQLPKKKGYPYGIKTKWPGLVKSPYAQDKTLVDTGGIPSGKFVRCPHTGKIFVVP